MDILFVLFLGAMIYVAVRHDKAKGNRPEIQGKPRRVFLRALTRFVLELRRLTPEERVRLAEEALRLYGTRWANQRAASLIFAFLGTGLVWGIIGLWVWPTVARELWITFGGDRFFWADGGMFAWSIVVFFSTCVVWFCVFVLQVHRSLRKRIDDLRCPSCKYSLIGLVPHVDGSVQCPECGKLAQVVTRNVPGAWSYRIVIP